MNISKKKKLKTHTQTMNGVWKKKSYLKNEINNLKKVNDERIKEIDERENEDLRKPKMMQNRKLERELKI